MMLNLKPELLTRWNPESGGKLPPHLSGCHAVKISDSTSPAVDNCLTLKMHTEVSGKACKASTQTDVFPISN